MIQEIYETIVKKKPAEDDLLAAAVAVVQVRYSDKEWDALNTAIGDLANICIRAGVQFNNPRIVQ